MYKRPQPDESDEDLLKLQEEFIKNKAENKLTPAAKIDVSTKQELGNQGGEEEDGMVLEQLSNTFEEIPNYKNLGNIVEKKIDIDYKPSLFKLQRTGFPIAKRREVLDKGNSTSSIFAQQFKKIKTNKEEKMDITSPHQNIESDKNLPSHSYIVTGNEKDDIHKENINRINEMTEAEILEERETLMSTMDPAIVAYLKSKRHQLSKINKPEGDMDMQIKASHGIEMKDLTAVSQVLNRPESEGWLNFSKMELSKLAWMKDVDFGQLKQKENYEARFDFDGWLLPYTEGEINEKNRILYHHGDEPGRPGYTLQELFQLCRSNIIQQKITALNAVANLLTLETSGVYDGVIEVPIELAFFVLRFCLDDNAPSILNASIKAMRNLFYYPIDEACLDSLLGFGMGMIQPCLLSEEIDRDDDNTVDDQQLAETNLVKCLSRTEILTRIRYVINTVKPPIETICYALEILIRLVRDSERIANLVFECDGLIPSIIINFIPKVFKENLSDADYGVPLKQAIKLCRLLATRNKNIAIKLIKKYDIMESILMYLSNDHYSSNTTGIQLQTESLHLWNVFLHYNLAIEQFPIIQPILLQMLHYHVQNTNQDTKSSYTMQGHAAAILILIGSMAQKENYYVILPYIDLITEQALNKWMTQFSNSEKFMCGKLVIISGLLHCLSSLYRSKANINRNKINNGVKIIIESNGFKSLTSDIKSNSNILCKQEPHKPCKNLLTAEAAVWNTSEHIVQILQTNSCLPFLNSLSKFIHNTDSNELKILFLRNENLNKYFEQIRLAKTYNFTSNWFTTIESEFLINVLKISYSICKSIDTSIFYDIAVKCLCVFNSRQKEDVEYILKNIIFNKHYYPSHTLLENLEIREENSILKDCVDNLNNIFTTYIQVLALRQDINNFDDNLTVDIKTGNIIPVDWIYSPIVVLYSDSQRGEQKLEESKLIFIIQNCLRWIYIYEKYFSSLASLISSTDKFCRLACLFLASDDIFFVPAVRTLLEASFKHFLTNDSNKLDFKKPVHGLSNFQDFYTQLLEQYQGVSYGDALFSNFILIPLMQKHNVQYRKLLWSEYAGIVQICSISKEQLMYPLDQFLQPTETDMSLLRCYRKWVVERKLRETSVLKVIAKHHLDTFVQNKRAS